MKDRNKRGWIAVVYVLFFLFGAWLGRTDIAMGCDADGVFTVGDDTYVCYRYIDTGNVDD